MNIVNVSWTTIGDPEVTPPISVVLTLADGRRLVYFREVTE